VSRSSESPRILLVRTSALGDIVQALPVLSALRRRLPGAAIAWVVDESFAPLLDGHELLDRILPVPLRRWRRSPAGRAREAVRFLGDLRRFRADVALDLMGNHKGALIALASGARRRIGLRRADRREPSSAAWLNELVTATGDHAVERMLAVARPLGIDQQVDFAPSALPRGGRAPAESAYVFLHPGAAWGNKRYPPERWGAVAARLHTATGVEILVGAAPGEEVLADAVVAASGGTARRFDAPTLSSLTAVLRGARLVLAADTGAAHLARALERPTVTVHGPTDPARHGVWGEANWTLVRRLPCSFCHRRMNEAKPCLLGISPESIVETVARRLESSTV